MGGPLRGLPGAGPGRGRLRWQLELLRGRCEAVGTPVSQAVEAFLGALVEPRADHFDQAEDLQDPSVIASAIDRSLQLERDLCRRERPPVVDRQNLEYRGPGRCGSGSGEPLATDHGGAAC